MNYYLLFAVLLDKDASALQKVTWVQIPGVEQGWLEGPGLEQSKERGVSKGRAQLTSHKAAARQGFGER